MENTLENKAKFFGQYFGVHCLRHEELPNIPALLITNIELCRPGLEVEYLELKPLSSISDEDAIEMSKFNEKIGSDHKFVFNSKESAIRYIKNNIHLSISSDRRSVDFLRSKGYAIPWMGLSVEELVNRGWIKLKGETK